jgi:hypothetical protein
MTLLTIARGAEAAPRPQEDSRARVVSVRDALAADAGEAEMPGSGASLARRFTNKRDQVVQPTMAEKGRYVRDLSSNGSQLYNPPLTYRANPKASIEA